MTRGQHHVEGCFRLSGEEWRVFHFTHWHQGALWMWKPIERPSAVFQSGVSGVDAVYPMSVILNKKTSMDLLSSILGGVFWDEVRGPDSIEIK